MTDAWHNSRELLKSIIERIEEREAAKKEIADDISDLYSEAKGAGLDAKALRAIIRERKQDVAEREELEAIKDSYRHALGMLSDLPLGQAAINSAR